MHPAKPQAKPLECLWKRNVCGLQKLPFSTVAKEDTDIGASTQDSLHPSNPCRLENVP